MDMLELDLVTRNLGFSDRSVWDAARILGLLTLMPHTKKRLKVKDVFSLPWDNVDDRITDGNVEDAEAMERMMKAMEEKFNKFVNNESKIQEQRT